MTLHPPGFVYLFFGGLFLDALADNIWLFVLNSLRVFKRSQMAPDSSIRENNTSRALFEERGRERKRGDLKSQRQKTDNLGHFFPVTDTIEPLLYHHTGLRFVN